MSVTADRPVKLDLHLLPSSGFRLQPLDLVQGVSQPPVEGVHVLLVPSYTTALFTTDTDCKLTLKTRPHDSSGMLRQVLSGGRCLCSGQGMVIFDGSAQHTR